MTVKLLTEHHLAFISLKGGCTGSSESTHVKMPHCLKSDVTAQNVLYSLSSILDINGVTRQRREAREAFTKRIRIFFNGIDVEKNFTCGNLKSIHCYIVIL